MCVGGAGSAGGVDAVAKRVAVVERAAAREHQLVSTQTFACFNISSVEMGNKSSEAQGSNCFGINFQHFECYRQCSHCCFNFLL